MDYYHPDAPRGLNNPSWQLARRRALRRDMTPAEKALWEALRRHGCGGVKFRRQHGFGPYILDFYCSPAQLALEVDGTVHDTDFAIAYDQTRDDFLQTYGIRVLRFPNEQVIHHLPTVLLEIEQALASPPLQPNQQKTPPLPTREIGEK